MTAPDVPGVRIANTMPLIVPLPTIEEDVAQLVPVLSLVGYTSFAGGSQHWRFARLVSTAVDTLPDTGDDDDNPHTMHVHAEAEQDEDTNTALVLADPTTLALLQNRVYTLECFPPGSVVGDSAECRAVRAVYLVPHAAVDTALLPPLCAQCGSPATSSSAAACVCGIVAFCNAGCHRKAAHSWHSSEICPAQQ